MPIIKPEIIHQHVVTTTHPTPIDIEIKPDHVIATPIIHEVTITPICFSCSTGGLKREFRRDMIDDELSYDLPEVPNMTPLEVLVNGVNVAFSITGVRITILPPYTPSDVGELDELLVYYYVN